MSPSVKAVLALVFVVVTGAVLIQPILDAAETPLVGAPEEDPTPARTKRFKSGPIPPRSPSPVPSAPSPGGAVSGAFRTQSFSQRYPAPCLGRRGAAPGDGEHLIAAVIGRRLTFGTTAGPGSVAARGGTSSGKVDAFLGFNLTAELYAASSGNRAFVSAPEGAQGADGDSGLGNIETVVWSPASSCGVAIGEHGSLLALPYDGGGPLLRADVTAAGFSPDGRKLAVVLDEAGTTSVWVGDLHGTTLREVHRARDRPVELKAWSPDGTTLYLSFGPDSGLSSLTVQRTSVPPVSGGVVATPVTALAQCGGRLVGIVNGRVADISTRGPDYLTPGGTEYSAASCSPEGSFIAAIRSGRLVLLDGNGNVVRDLTTDTGYRDVFVDWGPRGAGLLFGRVAQGSNAAEVWYVPEGGTARATGLTYTPGGGAIDWSASPPTGLPLR